MQTTLKLALNDTRLSDSEQRLFQDVFNMSKKHGYCFAKNSTLAKKRSKTTRTIQRYIARLKELGYVTVQIITNEFKEVVERRIFIASNVMTPHDTADMVNNNTNKGLNRERSLKTETEKITELESVYPKHEVKQAINIAKDKAKYNVMAYAQTLLENGLNKAKNTANFRHVMKKNVRVEQVPDYLQASVACHAPNLDTILNNSVVETSTNTNNHSKEAIIEQMKARQKELLGY